MPRKRQRNPSWIGTALVVGAGAVVATGIYLATLHFSKRKLAPQPKGESGPSGTPPWWIDALQGQMPPAADFPMGWDIDDVGFYDETMGADYRFAWRVLKLRRPSIRCSPPCEYIVVTNGRGHGKSVDDWQAAKDHAEALTILTAKHEEVAGGHPTQT